MCLIVIFYDWLKSHISKRITTLCYNILMSAFEFWIHKVVYVAKRLRWGGNCNAYLLLSVPCVAVRRFKLVCVDRVVGPRDRRSVPMGWRLKRDVHFLGCRWVISYWVCLLLTACHVDNISITKLFLTHYVARRYCDPSCCGLVSSFVGVFLCSWICVGAEYLENGWR